jgi:hypothetical protein
MLCLWKLLQPTDGGDGSYNLAQLQLIQDGGLTSGIKTDLDDSQ